MISSRWLRNQNIATWGARSWLGALLSDQRHLFRPNCHLKSHTFETLLGHYYWRLQHARRHMERFSSSCFLLERTFPAAASRVCCPFTIFCSLAKVCTGEQLAVANFFPFSCFNKMPATSSSYVELGADSKPPISSPSLEMNLMSEST